MKEIKKNKAVEKAKEFLKKSKFKESEYGELICVKSDLPFSWVVIFNKGNKQHHVVSEFGALGSMSLHETSYTEEQLKEFIDHPKKASVVDLFNASPFIALLTLVVICLVVTTAIHKQGWAVEVEYSILALLALTAIPISGWLHRNRSGNT